MTSFKKQKSIPNQNNKNTLDYYRENGYFDKEVFWVSSEKVHGANFSAVCEGGKISYASRDSILTENFHNHLENIQKIEPALLELYQLLDKKDFQVYFEYYGGGIVSSAKIEYTKNNEKEFGAYRLNVEGVTIPKLDAYLLFEKAGLKYIPIKGTNNFDELFKNALSKEGNNGRNSIIAKSNGIDTLAEGEILEPVIPINLVTGEEVRIKVVYEEFSETKSKAEAKNFQKFQPKAAYSPEELQSLRTQVDNELTEVRIGKVAAKLGITPLEGQKFVALLNGLATDIKEELSLPDDLFATIKSACAPFTKKFFK